MERPFDKLLVLDLDETLIHTVELRDETAYCERDPDIWIDDTSLASYKRPGVEEFLTWCFENYAAVGLWTAGTRPYAFEVLPHLCNPNDFAFVWGRERCTWKFDFERGESDWIKDIRKLRRMGYSKQKILCVDDTPEKFKRSYGNYIRVQAFEGDPEDTELEQLARYLETLGPVPNVRTIEKRGWRLSL